MEEVFIYVLWDKNYYSVDVTTFHRLDDAKAQMLSDLVSDYEMNEAELLNAEEGKYFADGETKVNSSFCSEHPHVWRDSEWEAWITRQEVL
jgi:hypothetical protein